MSDDARKLAVLGETLRQEGNYSGAIGCFTKAIELRKSYWWAYAHRAAARAALGDFSGALQDFRHQKVNEYYEQHNQGWFLAQKGELFRIWAMAATSKGDERGASQDAHVRAEIPQGFIRWDTLSQHAIELFTEALGKSEPRNPWVLAHRGATHTMRYWVRADMPRALSTAERASFMDDKDLTSDKFDYARAEADFNEALTLNPTYGWVYLFRAILHATRVYHGLTPRTVANEMREDMEQTRLDVGNAQMSGLNRELTMVRTLMELSIYTGGEIAMSFPKDRSAKESARSLFRDGVQLAWRTLQIESDETLARYFVANGLRQLELIDEDDAKYLKHRLEPGADAVQDPMVKAAISRARAALDGMRARVLAMSGGLDCLAGDLPSARKTLEELWKLRDLQAMTIVSRDPAWIPLRAEIQAETKRG